MDISLAQLSGGFFLGSIAYLILALQVRLGFPPFYRRLSLDFPFSGDAAAEKMLKNVILTCGGVMGLAGLYALTAFPVFSLLAGLLSIWAGLRLRHDLLREAGGPLPWVMFPLVLPWVVRWPMLLFDIWTLGLALGFGLLTRL